MENIKQDETIKAFSFVLLDYWMEKKKNRTKRWE